MMTASIQVLRVLLHSFRPILLGLLSAVAATAAVVDFDIPAQPAPAALDLFIKQSGAQVVYLLADVQEVRTNEVKGGYEPAAALAILLQDTGLSGAERNPGQFSVGRIAPKPGAVRGTLTLPSGDAAEGVTVRVWETTQSTATDRNGEFFFSVVEPGTYRLVVTAEGYQPLHITDVTVHASREVALGGLQLRAADEVTKLQPVLVRAESIEKLDPYDVEGRRVEPFVAGNLDIPRTINDAQPYYIFDSQAIDTSAATNIEDFLKQRLTMNTIAQTNGAMSGYNRNGNTSSINLRGVGTDKTLILVDGRRMAGVTVGSSEYQTDLNGIPVSAVERIEVLPSSASGIYGGSAIGGVVNVILKRNFQGGEIRTTYDNTWDTHSPRRNVSFSYGMALEGGKTHVSLSGSWEDAEPLLLQERGDIFRSTLDELVARSPSYFYSATSPWVGALPNISTNAASLVLKDGTSLNSKFTYVPAGTSSTTTASTLTSGLLANAGGWNMDFPTGTQSPTGLLRPYGTTPKTESLRAAVRRQMLPQLELFAEVSYNSNQTDSLYNAASSVITVSASAPTNPFNSTVYVSVPDASDMPITTRSENRSATVGARAQLPRGWTGALDYTWSENRFDYLYYSTDSTARSADLASGALNLFVDSLLHPIDWSKYLQRATYEGITREHDLNLKASGALPSLPWGQPNLTVGLEHRIVQQPKMYYRYAYATTVANSYELIYYPRKSTTDAGYAEMSLPLLKQGWLPGVHALELQASGREERYTVDTGTTYQMVYYNDTPPTTYYGSPTLNGQPYFSETSYNSRNYTLGLKYQPVPDVTLRVSRATAFLPPTPSQLVKNPEVSTTLTTITDPTTGEKVSVPTVSGGNPDLTPQNARNLNAGIIWEPRWTPLQGLRLNAEYSKIEQFDAISSLSAQVIVNQESVFPDRVTRDASGTITLVDISSLNLYRRETEGWDLTASYTRDTPVGAFTLSAMESILLHSKTQYSLTQPEYEAAGYSPGEFGAPKYKSVGSLNWAWRGWNAGWTARYFGAYKQYGAAGGPYSKQYSGGAAYTYYTNVQGSDTIPSQLYHDVVLGYAFQQRKPAAGKSGLSTLGSKLLSGLSVQFGVRNVFDTVPPVDVYYSTNYYRSPYGDMRLRSYWLTLKKSF